MPRRRWCRTPALCDEAEWWQRFEAVLERDLAAARRSARGQSYADSRRPEGRRVVQGTASATVAIAELVSSGASVLAVCADASRRAALANGATGLARFNGGAALIACHRCGDEEIEGL